MMIRALVAIALLGEWADAVFGQPPTALSCCFSSQSNFTRAFRRTAGMTPREYRNCDRSIFAAAIGHQVPQNVR